MPHRGFRPDSDAHRVTDELAGRTLPASFSAASGVVTHNRDLWAPPVRNQRKSNFCVRFAGCDALDFLRVKAGKPSAPFSPLFASWNDAMPGERGQNVGTMIYLFAQAAKTIGVCSEDAYPWELTADDYLTRMKVRPPEFAYTEAERHQATGSYRLLDGDPGQILASLQKGLVVQIGFPVDKGFEDTGADGMAPPFVPADLLGWHSTLVVDADMIDGTQYFWVRNSWGPTWGKGGNYLVRATEATRWRDGRVYTDTELV